MWGLDRYDRHSIEVQQLVYGPGVVRAARAATRKPPGSWIPTPPNAQRGPQLLGNRCMHALGEDYFPGKPPAEFDGRDTDRTSRDDAFCRGCRRYYCRRVAEGLDSRCWTELKGDLDGALEARRTWFKEGWDVVGREKDMRDGVGGYPEWKKEDEWRDQVMRYCDQYTYWFGLPALWRVVQGADFGFGIELLP